MKHTKEQVLAIVKKLLSDLEREYNKGKEINIGFNQNLKIVYWKKVLPNGWWASVSVHDDWFNNDDGVLSIYVDDDTGEIEGYEDGSGGRPVPMRAKKDAAGKYYLEVVPH